MGLYVSNCYIILATCLAIDTRYLTSGPHLTKLLKATARAKLKPCNKMSNYTKMF